MRVKVSSKKGTAYNGPESCRVVSQGRRLAGSGDGGTLRDLTGGAG